MPFLDLLLLGLFDSIPQRQETTKTGGLLAVQHQRIRCRCCFDHGGYAPSHYLLAVDPRLAVLANCRSSNFATNKSIAIY